MAKFKMEDNRDSFAAHAFIRAITENGVVSQEFAKKYQDEDGLDVKLIIDGKEYNFKKVFDKFQAHFDREVAQFVKSQTNKPQRPWTKKSLRKQIAQYKRPY